MAGPIWLSGGFRLGKNLCDPRVEMVMLYVLESRLIEPLSDPITGGRGGITQGVSFEFFESFLLIYSHNTHWANFEFF